MIGTLSIYNLLAKRFQDSSTRCPEVDEEDTYRAIRMLLTDHNAIMQSMLNDLADFTTGREKGPQSMELKDADALRVLSDRLEELGEDAGAALLRDIAGRLDAKARPRFVDWPEELGVGELLVRSVEVRTERPIHDASRFDYLGIHGPPPKYRFLIEAEPIVVWTVHEVDRPSGRVRYLL
jgi:hypothetical protein